MTCREFSLLISARLDGRASAGQAERLARHLDVCAACRQRAAELRCLRDELRTLDRRAPSPELAAGIVAALQREARQQARAARQQADLIDVWRMRIFSQGVGTVVSLALFFLLVSVVLKPFYRAVANAQATTDEVTISYVDNTEQVRQLKLVLMPPTPNNPRPIFDPGGALIGFSQDFSEDEFIVAVTVDKDGRASVKRVVEPPRDPAVIPRLSNALIQQASFQPASRRGRFISSDAVLMFSKMNIPG